MFSVPGLRKCLFISVSEVQKSPQLKRRLDLSYRPSVQDLLALNGATADYNQLNSRCCPMVAAINAQGFLQTQCLVLSLQHGRFWTRSLCRTAQFCVSGDHAPMKTLLWTSNCIPAPESFSWWIDGVSVMSKNWLPNKWFIRLLLNCIPKMVPALSMFQDKPRHKPSPSPLNQLWYRFF